MYFLETVNEHEKEKVICIDVPENLEKFTSKQQISK